MKNRMYTRTIPRKKPHHPVFVYLIKHMPKYNYSHYSKPKDDEIIAHALLWIKKERVRWTPTKTTIFRTKLIQHRMPNKQIHSCSIINLVKGRIRPRKEMDRIPRNRVSYFLNVKLFCYILKRGNFVNKYGFSCNKRNVFIFE